MPRIRKKTTRRGTTNQREKIKHKVSETRKKRKKEGKKNPQWKSKQKKDPGIPNNFPYKDQILAEVAEERRQAAETKQRRKDEKKALKATQNSGADNASDDEGSEAAFDGVAAITSAKTTASSSKTKISPAIETIEDEEAPVLLNDEFPTLKAVLDAADVIIEVLDARDPLAYHSANLEELVKGQDGKKLLIVLNKIDGSPREAISSWATHFRAQHPTVLFRSASAFLPSSEPSPVKGKGKERADDAVGASAVIAALERWSAEKPSGDRLLAAVVGSTNSGKSSFINSLARKSVLPVYKLSNPQDGPTTTIFPQEVTLEVGGNSIRLVDTPGFSWLPSEVEESPETNAHVRAQGILIRNKGRIDRLKDPEPVVHEIVVRASREDLMLFYNLPAFADKDADAFLSALARANGLIKKGGVLDTIGASRILLRDWSTGKFPRFTLPGSASSTPVDSSLSDLYATDEKILAILPTRKERRKTDGVVKLSASTQEARKLSLDAPWVVEDVQDAGGSDEDNIEDGDDVEPSEGQSEDGDEDDDEDEDVAPPAGKRKRSVQHSAPARPAKKVAFAAEPKGTKLSRSAAGARGSLAAPDKGTKSISRPAKTQVKTKVAKATPVKKVANAAPSKKPAAVNATTNGGAYDFKQFF